MSRELTEKKRRHIRGNKAVVRQEMIQESCQAPQAPKTPYTGNYGNGRLTSGLQVLDDFNLTEWVGG